MKNNKKKRLFTTLVIILFLISISTIFIVNDNLKEKKELKSTQNSNNKEEESNTHEDKVIENKEEEKIEKENTDDKKDNSSTNKPSNQKPTNNKNTNTNSSSNKPSNNESSNKPSEKPSNSNTNTNTKPEEKPITPPKEDKNDTKRKSIEKAYGIKIVYGNEIGDYKPKGITPTKLTSESDIENYLNRLNIELAKYPKGFFQDFNKKGMPLTIYLIKSANGSFSGFTDYQFMNNIKMTLATDYNFEYTVHHEMMHYIDCYLNIVMYPKTPYEEYEALNPKDFTYGNATNKQIYNMGTNQRGAYFISQYGSTHVAEDRAEVFKFMTARAYAPTGCFEKDEVIRKKAEVISRQIKTYFPSVSGSAHWDRFIK